MLAEFTPHDRDYYIYLDESDIVELLSGSVVESPMIVRREKDIDKKTIRLKVTKEVIKGEISRNILWEINPTTFTFSEEYFKEEVLDESIYKRTDGYSEVRYNTSGSKIHFYKGDHFYSRSFKDIASHRLENFALYVKRYAELRERDRESD